MKLPFDGNREFIPAPEGRHRAVCVDVVDLGTIETNFGPKEKQRVTWEIDSLMDLDERTGDRRRFIVTNRYTASLDERSNLRRDLICWFGRDFTDEEQVEGFETEELVGQACWLSIVHKAGTYQNKPTTFANIAQIISLVEGDDALVPSGKYVRVKDRERTETDVSPGPNVGAYGVQEREDPISQPQQQAASEVTDDDIPF